VDFFTYQKQARNKSRLLIIGVLFAALLIICAINLFVLLFLGWSDISQISSLGRPVNLNSLFSLDSLRLHSNTLLTSSGLVAGLMTIASTGKVMSLKDGGGKVARQLGGDLITPDNKDPLRRRLYNVVEEIAIASGVPVPEVYVLEQEAGINAFAAGFTQSDSAVAVTKGALEQFDRNELQGVIAHEFSHILNGDTRINIRLMGLIFGILVLSILGRKMLTGSRRTRMSSNDNKGISVILLLGLGLTIVGYTGLFIARWIKAAISRQREFLADASAVQFTRNPDGISNALKKIAIAHDQSYLKTESEEVSHMLFGDGQRPSFFSSKLFATHPPLMDRIQRIEPQFKEQDLLEFGKKLRKKHLHAEAKKAEQESEKKGINNKKHAFDITHVLQDIGHPSLEQILLAGVIADSVPDIIEQSAHSVEWAPEVMLFLVLASDQKIRDKQLSIISKDMGHWTDQKIEHLLSSTEIIDLKQRLPILEMAFPQVKNRPIEELEKLLATLNTIVKLDDRVDTFEYLMCKLIETHIKDALNPDKAVVIGSKNLSQYKPHTVMLLSILAHETNKYPAKAFKVGMKSLGWSSEKYIEVDNWHQSIDVSLDRLNKLKSDEKRKLVIALSEVILHDKKVTISEHEILRAVCASLHIPLPVLA